MLYLSLSLRALYTFLAKGLPSELHAVPCAAMGTFVAKGEQSDRLGQSTFRRLVYRRRTKINGGHICQREVVAMRIGGFIWDKGQSNFQKARLCLRLASRIPADAYNQLYRVDGGARWPWVSCSYIALKNTYLR